MKKRKNFNMKILNNFQKIQLSLDLKRKKSMSTHRMVNSLSKVKKKIKKQKPDISTKV